MKTCATDLSAVEHFESAQTTTALPSSWSLRAKAEKPPSRVTSTNVERPLREYARSSASMTSSMSAAFFVPAASNA